MSGFIRIILVAAAFFLFGVLGGALLSRPDRALNTEATIDSGPGVLERIIVKNVKRKPFAPQLSKSASSFDAALSRPTGFQQYLATYNLAENSSVADLRGLIKQALGQQDRFYQFGMATIFLEKFVELDAKSALDFVLNDISSGNLLYNQLVGVVFREWGRTDTEAAIEALSLVTNRRLKQSLLMQMLDDDMINLTSGALDLAQDLLPQQQSQLALRRINRIAPRDAFQASLMLRPNERLQALYAAVTRWIGTDPEAALAGIAQLTNLTEKNRLMNFAFGRWASIDPEAAIMAAPEYDRGDGSLISAVVGAMAQHSHLDALELAEGFRGEAFYDTVLTMVISRWSQSDPVAAIAYLEASSLSSANLLRAVASNYAQKFPLEAMTWAETLGAQAESIQRQISHIYARNDPDGAERYLSELNAGPIKGSLISQIASLKAGVNSADAMAWLSQYRGEAVFQQARNRVIQTWINNDVSATAVYIEDLISAGDNGAPQLAESLVGNWLHQDAQAAKEWIDNLDNSALKERTLRAYVVGRAQSNPDDALDLLDTITDDSTYSAMAQTVVRIILSRQPDRFDEITARVNLSAEEIVQLRQMTSIAARD